MWTTFYLLLRSCTPTILTALHPLSAMYLHTTSSILSQTQPVATHHNHHKMMNINIDEVTTSRAVTTNTVHNTEWCEYEESSPSQHIIFS